MSLFDNNAFIDMYSILEHEEDILLVYGRNSRDGHFSEPEEFGFFYADLTLEVNWVYVIMTA